MENITLEKIDFQNGSSGNTPLNRTNMNKIQENTQNALNELTPIITDIENNTDNNINDLLQVKTFIANSMKTLSAEGTSIHVTDSADYPCSLKVEGKSEQVQTENSPSPDYPSEIENVSGDLEIKTVAKNLMKCEADVQTKYGVTITKTNDGGYILNGTSTGIGSNGITLVSFEHNFPLLKNSSYAYSVALENIPNKRVSFPIAVKQVDGTIKHNYKRINTESATAPVVFIPSEDLTTDNVAVYIHNGTVFNNFKFKIQIEEGTVATDYEPYKEQTVTFPFSEGQKLMQGGYLGENGVVNKRKQLTLTGNENWQRQGTTHTNVLNLYLTLESKGANRDNVLCSVAKQSDSCGANNDSIVDICNLNTTLANFLIDLDLSEFADITAWKTYLAEQYSAGTPVVIEYELEEEETTAYTSTQQTAYNTLQKFKTYRTTTNISNNQDTNMQLTYKMDLQTQIQGGGSSG